MSRRYLDPNLSGLRQQLRKFDEDGHYVSGTHWSIARGGYDLWWQVSYDRLPIISCVAGHLDIETTTLSDAYIKKLHKLICAEYEPMKLRTEE